MTVEPTQQPAAGHNPTTEHLELVPRSIDDVRAQVAAMDAATRAQLSPGWLALLQAARTADPWEHGFAVVHRGSGQVVGSCGFKGPPADGIVEIAYGMFLEQRGRGYATETAQALTAYAFSFAEVRVVRAHTLPESAASQRVLGKCGFERVGEVVDPEDGLVRRYEQRRPPNQGRG